MPILNSIGALSLKESTTNQIKEWKFDTIINSLISDTSVYLPADPLRTIALSSDGNILLFGEPYNQYYVSSGGGIITRRGAIFIYNYINGSWGYPSKYTNTNVTPYWRGESLGTIVDISNDGTSIVVGNDYKVINGAAAQGAFYYSRSLTMFSDIMSRPFISGDGKTIVVAPKFTGTLSSAAVKNYVGIYYNCYDYSGNLTWSNYQTLSPDIKSSNYGISSALSFDGKILAIGAPGESSVYVYEKDNNNNYVLSKKITNSSITNFGISVGLSDSGKILVINNLFIYNNLSLEFSDTITTDRVAISSNGNDIICYNYNNSQSIITYTKFNGYWKKQILNISLSGFVSADVQSDIIVVHSTGNGISSFRR